MLTKNKKNREIIYRNNKPVSIILDIREYEKMIERLEDIEDIEFVKKIKSNSMSFIKLEDFLTEIA
ncbi:MAG: type II toxin-antitoxin system Phd/YefM family antitoxin [Bacteroidetes bacterium]|nr:type II toxin-antitoxin system Phd/YefM family antitoxin [Bacteroidota bacterium]